MINQNTVDQIFAAIDIKEVISDFVKLKKSGVNWSGSCPFHNEKTASFIVSPSKGIYHCFGCGKGGNAVNFIMEHKNETYPDALKYLANKYSIEVIEDNKPKDSKKQAAKEQLFLINQMANDFFRTKPGLFGPENTLTAELINARFTDEEITQWQIGFIPDKWDLLLMHLKEAGIKEDFLLKSNLIKQSEKNYQLFDYFRGRIIFPIFDNYGRPVAFGGRIIPTIPVDKKQPKYINSPESEIYNKSVVLYGINFARKEIVKQKIANIVEGYTDTISMHTAGQTNTVGSCGTSLTIDQLKQIKKLAPAINLLLDNDNAGLKATIRAGQLAIETGLNVYVTFLPFGHDPDSFCKNPDYDINIFINKNKVDFVTWYANDLLNKAGTDPARKNDAITEISNLLVKLSTTKRELYIEQINKTSKIKAKLFNDCIKDIENTMIDDFIEDHQIIPKGIDSNEFEKWGFYEFDNEYTFRTKYGLEKLSNFTMKAVFHIDSVFDSKRIFEMTNFHGHRVVINLDMNEMTSIQSFQRHIESKGNFMFWGQMHHFQKLKLKLYEETRTCKLIENLGWQKEGFWCFANGYIHPETGEFIEIDEYGVINYDSQDYFIPAFSKIYLKDKSIFIDERKFKFEQSNVKLLDWMNLFYKVHGENAKIGFAFYLASLFRDHILYLNDNFPILNLYGQRGSGKNTLAYSLLSLFGKKQTEFNIHNGTKAGLAKHLGMFNNSLAFIDEYKNSLDFDKIETLKSIYNAIGRSRLNMDKGMKKETTEVLLAVILAGQEMPTIDIALSTRVIFLQFMKKENLTAEQKKLFEDLQNIERNGLSHITAEIIKYRQFFIDNYKESYQAVLKDLIDNLKGEEIDDRLVRNMTSICAAFHTLEPKFDFSFNYQSLLSTAVEVTREHSKQIKQSDEIGIFWNLLEALYNDDLLTDGWDFKIKHQEELVTNKGQLLRFPEGKLILEFKFNAVAKLYAEQLRKRGEKPLPQDSLKHYLSTSKHFLGIKSSSKFVLKKYDSAEGKSITQKQTTSSFCFDYEHLGINLIREAVESISDKNEEDRPF